MQRFALNKRWWCQRLWAYYTCCLPCNSCHLMLLKYAGSQYRLHGANTCGGSASRFWRSQVDPEPTVSSGPWPWYVRASLLGKALLIQHPPLLRGYSESSECPQAAPAGQGGRQPIPSNWHSRHAAPEPGATMAHGCGQIQSGPRSFNAEGGTPDTVAGTPPQRPVV